MLNKFVNETSLFQRDEEEENCSEDTQLSECDISQYTNPMLKRIIGELFTEQD